MPVMTTSADAGVAPLIVEDTLPPLPPSLYIVGFAPSWSDTPWDKPDAHYWGMNALHKVAPDKRWNAWFQLHDIDQHHPNDKDEHIEWLNSQSFPVFMWEEHIGRYNIPNAVPYPREMILAKYGSYFTNTVSWMIAYGIETGFQNLAVYGVDMAQDTEYQSQRPSCEFFLGWAAGAGINVEVPRTSDLLKAPFLYGIEDGSIMTQKYKARLKELMERRADFERQRNQSHEAALQIAGAIEDTQYWLRAWSQEEVKKNG